MKKIKPTKFLILILTLVFFLLISCSKSEVRSYDGLSFDISATKDKPVVANIKKIDNNYELIINGSGNTLDFIKKENVPWYAISKKISNIKINDGLNEIGAHIFESISLNEVILPKSVSKIEKNSFNINTTIYSYSEYILNNELKIYYYSENKPESDGYFRMVDGKPMIWKNEKVLFVGNSFTYRGGSEENPMVPKYFYELGLSLNIDISIDYVLKGSHSLTKFASVDDTYGKILDDKLKTNQYSYIILQEQSVTPINSYDNFYKAVGLLKDKIEKYQKDAKIYLYETWGFPELINNKTYKSIEEMENLLFNAYTKCKNEYKLNITYVGKAFTYLNNNYPDIKLYDDDLKHQSNIGSFLSACCHLVNIFDIDIRKSNYVGEFDSVLAKTLKDTAYMITTKYKA